jgi:hypothetical protein
MPKHQTRSELAEFLDTPLGAIDRAFCDLQLATHWLLYAAGYINQKDDLRKHLQASAAFAERALGHIRTLLQQTESPTSARPIEPKA